MADEKPKHEREEPTEKPVAVGAEQPDLPGEGELPRREDMGPGDHRARDESDEGQRG